MQGPETWRIEALEQRMKRLEDKVEGNGWRDHRREVTNMLDEWNEFRDSRGGLRMQVAVLWGIQAAIGLAVLAWVMKSILP